MMSLIIPLLITCLTVVISTYLLPGVHVDGWLTVLIVTIVMTTINIVFKPILVLISLPLTILTLGLFLLVINTALVMLTDWLIPGFRVDSWWSALFFSLIVSVVSSALNRLAK